jgi:hypothetical protein
LVVAAGGETVLEGTAIAGPDTDRSGRNGRPSSPAQARKNALALCMAASEAGCAPTGGAGGSAMSGKPTVP